MGDKTRFKLETADRLIQIYLETNQLQNVGAVLKDMGAGRTAQQRVTIQVTKATIEERQKRYAQAQQLYQQAIDMSGGEPELAVQASWDRPMPPGPEEARRSQPAAAGDHTATPLRGAGPGTGLPPPGRRPQGAGRKRQQWEDALLAYLRVPTLYGGDESTEARALYEAAAAAARSAARRAPGGPTA